jgi:hypothetical protein
MERLGYRDHAKDSARCPFHHPDRNPSFGTFQREGQWFWKCQAGCGHGDEITFLEKTQGLSRTEATKAFLRMAGVAVVGASANGATFTPRERNATLAVAQPAPASPQVNAASSKRSNEVNAVSTVVSRISEEKHLPNTYPTPTSHLPQHQPNTYSIPAAMLASAYEEKIASERIKSEGRDGQINYQDWLKQLTREEKLVYRAFKSKARASGFRVIWGMARRHAKVGNKWFPIKDSYLREKLGYRDKSSIYDLIETLRDLEVLAPHPGNGHGLDYNLYRWSLPTNIWEMDNGTCGDDDEMPF